MKFHFASLPPTNRLQSITHLSDEARYKGLFKYGQRCKEVDFSPRNVRETFKWVLREKNKFQGIDPVSMEISTCSMQVQLVNELATVSAGA